jgi:transcriptional regulator with XRE-family HTH domain
MSTELDGSSILDRRRVGATLRTLRELRGFKPDQFASAIGISRPYLANIEAGRRQLPEVLLARAAETLRVEQIAIMLPPKPVTAA